MNILSAGRFLPGHGHHASHEERLPGFGVLYDANPLGHYRGQQNDAYAVIELSPEESARLSPADAARFMIDAFNAANQAALPTGRRTTMNLVMIHQGAALFANLGDSVTLVETAGETHQASGVDANEEGFLHSYLGDYRAFGGGDIHLLQSSAALTAITVATDGAMKPVTGDNRTRITADPASLPRDRSYVIAVCDGIGKHSREAAEAAIEGVWQALGASLGRKAGPMALAAPAHAAASQEIHDAFTALAAMAQDRRGVVSVNEARGTIQLLTGPYDDIQKAHGLLQTLERHGAVTAQQLGYQVTGAYRAQLAQAIRLQERGHQL